MMMMGVTVGLLPITVTVTTRPRPSLPGGPDGGGVPVTVSPSRQLLSNWIKSVAVQLITRPQYVGDGEAGGGGAAGAWRPQPAPSRRPGAMI